MGSPCSRPPRRLAAAMGAIRARESVSSAAGWLAPLGGAHLRSGAEMAAIFAHRPEVVTAAAELGEQCAFGLALIALVLLALLGATYLVAPRPAEGWLVLMCASYLAATLFLRAFGKPRPPGQTFDAQWVSTIGVDLIAFSVLIMLLFCVFSFELRQQLCLLFSQSQVFQKFRSSKPGTAQRLFQTPATNLSMVSRQQNWRYFHLF